MSLLVLLVGLIIAAGLSWTSFELNQKNEDRLLRLEAKQAATVLDAVVPTIQTPLASAAYVATAGSNSGADFRGYIQSYLGAGQPFVSASLWRLSGRSAQLITVVGSSPMLAADPAAASSFLASATGGSGFGLTGPLGTVARSRLGYALPAQKGSEKYVVYAESALPAGRVALVTPGSPFSDLRFALYLGSSPRSDMLLEANSGQLPISGRTEAVRVRFGAGALLLVAAPARPIGGALATSLWWILAAAGGVLAVIAAATAEGLMRRRLAAERLTGEVRHLLGEQRTIAETLQHALLPETLPVMAGVQAAVRYLPGTNGVEIGGDWYDVMPLDDTRFFFVVGDVSGRGVPAGSVMASLRFAIRGFVSEGHPPETVLSALGGLLDLAEDHRFATVVCGVADVARHEITIANAGHPPPLCIGAEGTEYVSTPVGPPVGVANGHHYRCGRIVMPAGGTLLVYTDGLIERRGENIDDGLRRLRTVAAAASTMPLDEMVDSVVQQLSHDGHDDDTAILAVRWLT